MYESRSPRPSEAVSVHNILLSRWSALTLYFRVTEGSHRVVAVGMTTLTSTLPAPMSRYSNFATTQGAANRRDHEVIHAPLAWEPPSAAVMSACHPASSTQVRIAESRDF